MPALSAERNCLWRRSFQPCWPRPKIDSLLAQSLLLFFILESQVEGWVRNLVPLPAGTAAQGKTCVRANPALEAVRPSHRTGLRLTISSLVVNVNVKQTSREVTHAQVMACARPHHAPGAVMRCRQSPRSPAAQAQPSPPHVTAPPHTPSSSPPPIESYC